MSQDKVSDLPTEGLKPSAGHSKAHKDTQTSSIDTRLGEIVLEIGQKAIRWKALQNSTSQRINKKWADEATQALTRLITESKIHDFNRREQKRISTLKRRVAILEERINTDTRDLSYDKAEAKALRWIISLAEGIDLVELRRIDELNHANPPKEELKEEL